MAFVSVTSVGIAASPNSCSRLIQFGGRASTLQSVSFATRNRWFSLKPGIFRVSCTANGEAPKEEKRETMQKIAEVLRDQLDVKDEAKLQPHSTFEDIGADSLDTAEIAMALEEHYGITIEQDKTESVKTLKDFADLIDTLVKEKATAL